MLTTKPSDTACRMLTLRPSRWAARTSNLKGGFLPDSMASELSETCRSGRAAMPRCTAPVQVHQWHDSTSSKADMQPGVSCLTCDHAMHTWLVHMTCWANNAEPLLSCLDISRQIERSSCTAHVSNVDNMPSRTGPKQPSVLQQAWLLIVCYYADDNA